MRLLKFDLQGGLIASVLAAAALVVALPAMYDAFGEGPMLVKAAAKSSPVATQVCGGLTHFIIIPWRLSLSDSAYQGELGISYWVWCSGALSRIDASLNHVGDGWRMKSLALVNGRARHDLVK
jgi:hypothetical protein